jgi:TAT (twin-arginine translocation) pathway signal sequence
MPSNLNRRRFLQAGGAAAGASLLGPLLGNRANAAALDDVVSAAGVANTAQLNIHAPSNPFFNQIDLASTTPMQSFAFDSDNLNVYTVQLTVNGTLGELTCTKLDFAGHEVEPSWLHLRGFGHGVQIGVQPVGGSAYVWVETLVADSGYGTQIARFMFDDFAHGQTLTPQTSGVVIYEPRPTYTSKSIAIDNTYRRASLRYRIDADTVRIDLFDLDQFSAHKYATPPLASLTISDSDFLGHAGTTTTPTFQGHTTYGSYLYLLTGVIGQDNAVIWAYDWNKPGTATDPIEPADTFLTQAGISLPNREPEGMAIWEDAQGTPHLTLGLASHVTGGSHKASIYYK